MKYETEVKESSQSGLGYTWFQFKNPRTLSYKTTVQGDLLWALLRSKGSKEEFRFVIARNYMKSLINRS